MDDTSRTAPDHARLHHVEMVMGMAVSFDLRVDPDRLDAAREGVAEVITWLHHVDATFSTYKVESPISRLGTGAATLDEMSDEVLGVLALCEDLFVDSDGAFDALAVPAPNGSRFDPSGLVKGWSVERAVEILERHGVEHLCINAGGDIAMRGVPAPGESWRIGVRHPDESHLFAAVLEGSGRLAVATSATYERGAHIIDPATGEPTTEVASVTIVGPDLTFVDAYATAVFVMGVPGLEWLLERHPDHAGFVITRDGTAYSTPNFADHRVLAASA
jgi:thiamine biosynthesis lipoprotein